jgi:S1-C subfamily serine protease
MKPQGNARSVLLFLLAFAVVAFLLFPRVRDLWYGSDAEPRVVTARGDLAAEEQTTIAVFEQASPSVVYITTVGRRVDFWTRNVVEVPQGAGSGFVWDERGHVVTNLHVIASADRALVMLDDRRAYDASLVGISPEHDLAVLRIDVPIKPPPPLPVGSSSELRVGQKVFAIGNPFGLDRTLTTGVVSAIDRTIPGAGGRDIEHLIQTDAAINPGNSGGPLIDSAGRLIGVNTMIYSPSGAYAGVGFAVPVDTVNRVVPQLIASGRYTRPLLGVRADDRASARVARELGVEGVLVLAVTPGSPAERAGIVGTQLAEDGSVIPGDVIESVDGRGVERFDQLLQRLDDHVAGDTVTLALYRDGERREVEVELAAP